MCIWTSNKMKYFSSPKISIVANLANYSFYLIPIRDHLVFTVRRLSLLTEYTKKYLKNDS